MKEYMFDGRLGAPSREIPVCPFCKSTEGFRLRGYRGLGLLLLCDACGKDFVESLKVVTFEASKVVGHA